MENNIILGKDICTNGVKADVKLKIDYDNYKVYGYINKCKFMWKYSKYLYPRLQVANNLHNRRVALNFVLETLRKNDIDHTDIIKISRLSEDSLFFDLKDGLWFSVYINGYIRGEIDGTEFVWDTKKYSNILLVEKGQYIKKMKSTRIISRIREEGYHSSVDLQEAIKQNMANLSNLQIAEGAFLDDTDKTYSESENNNPHNVDTNVTPKVPCMDELNLDNLDLSSINITYDDAYIDVGNN